MLIPFPRCHLTRILLSILVAAAFTLGYIFSTIYNFDLTDIKCTRNFNHLSSAKPLHLEYAYLVVIILSSPINAEQRQAIRGTWLLTKKNYSIRHYFALSVGSLSAGQLTELKKEHNTHQDLIFFDSLSDSYTKLSEKIKEVFKWVHLHFQFKFLLKVDDDSFVRLDGLYKSLVRLPQEKLYWGFFDGQASVKRRGKWKEDSWFLCDRYLPYAKGGGYVLSHDLIELINSVSDHLVPYQSEDVSVGVWLAPFKVNRIHEPNFDTEFLSRGCFNTYLITHKQTQAMMKEKHKNLENYGHLCSSEERIRKSYVYDWNVLPSQCCKRTEAVP